MKNLCLELALVAGSSETQEESIERDRLQFLRLPADYSESRPPRTIQSYCEEASRSQSLYTLISSTQWLRTVFSLDNPLANLEIYSNVVPRQLYLKRLEDAIAGTTCLQHQCSGGFFPMRVLCQGEPLRQSCTDCALAKQLGIKTDDMAVVEVDKSLKHIVEQDVKLMSLIGEGSEGTVSTILWGRGTFVRKRFHSHQNAKFSRERAVAMTVMHSNIVHCFGCLSWPDSTDCDMFMEFLEEDLESFLNDLARTEDSGPQFSFRDILDVLLQIAEAMRHLHEKNFLHGDLKPGNILVSKLAMPHPGIQFYLIKVADFGCAQRVDSSGATVEPFDSKIGTLNYTAPEILRCRKQRGAPAPEHPQKMDVYSFGVLAYQVLTEVTSVYPEDLKDIRNRVMEGSLRPDYNLKHLPALDGDRLSLLPLIQSCWNPNPEDRPSFADICERLLGKLCFENEHGLQETNAKRKAISNVVILLKRMKGLWFGNKDS